MSTNERVPRKPWEPCRGEHDLGQVLEGATDIFNTRLSSHHNGDDEDDNDNAGL